MKNRKNPPFVTTFAICFIGWLLAPAASAIGLECRNSKTGEERLICSHATLKALNGDMSRVFEALNRRTNRPEDLFVDQQHWTRDVRNACHSAECMQLAYHERIRYLNDWLTQVQTPSKVTSSCTIAEAPEPENGCTQTLSCAENSDYSLFQAALSTCETAEPTLSAKETGARSLHRSPDMLHLKIYYYPKQAASPSLITSRDDLYGDPEVSWKLPDRNGFAELDIEQRSKCDAESDCFHDLYRYDPDAQSFYEFFSGYNDVSYIDGYLLARGRTGLCSWETRAHKVHRDGKRDVVDEKWFGVDENQNADANPGRCRFFESSQEAPYSKTIKPPSSKWYGLCLLSSLPCMAYPKSGIAFPQSGIVEP
jgi:uncharacterized protein